MMGHKYVDKGKYNDFCIIETMDETKCITGPRTLVIWRLRIRQRPRDYEPPIDMIYKVFEPFQISKNVV